jgi:hypothetical protein
MDAWTFPIFFIWAAILRDGHRQQGPLCKLEMPINRILNRRSDASFYMTLLEEYTAGRRYRHATKVTDIMAELMAASWTVRSLRTAVAMSATNQLSDLYIALDVPYDSAGPRGHSERATRDS